MSPGSDAPEDDFALMQRAVSEAAKIAMRYFGSDPKSWKKDDVSPVSEADLAVNDFLREALMGARPDYGWLSEESVDDPQRLSANRVWIVDPIDGTRAFLDGKPEFTICVGLAEQGRCIAAAVTNPATGESFTAERGRGAWRDGTRMKLGEAASLETSRILCRRNVFKPERWHGGVPESTRGYIGSIAYQLCVVAAGQWDAALAVNKLHEWDIAAAELILTEAGGRVTDQTGEPIRYNRESPRVNGMICAAPTLHARLAERLVPKD